MFTYLCAKFSKSVFIHPSIHYSIFISIVEKQPVRTVRILFEHLGWWMLECTSSCCRMLLRVGAESRGTARSFFAPLLLFFFLLFCLRDTIASFNILYLAPAKRGNSQGE